MTIGTTIRQLRKERGLTLNQLAALIESDVGNLSRLERGVQGYSDATLSKIAGALNVPVAAFFLKEGETLDQFGLSPGAYQRVEAVDDDDQRFVQIPMVELRLSAGVTGFQTEPDRRAGGMVGMRKHWIERGKFLPVNLIAIRVQGESMEPALYEDDVVVINIVDTRPVDGVVFAVNYEGEAVVKRFQRDAGDWWLTSDNPDQRKFHRKICRGEACIVIGRVVHKESDRI
jgi:phage repressor protein C with HTH and peptisase S24 domain